MDKTVWLGFVRHALTMVGGVLIAKGWVSESVWPEVLGAVMTLIGLVASWYSKQKVPA